MNTTRRLHRSAWALSVVLTLWAVGCAGPSGAQMNEIRQSYQAGQYQQSYNLATRASYGSGIMADEAAYMAGLSAYRLKQFGPAQQHLTRAAQSSDTKLSGDALAVLGVLYYETGRYNPAVTALLQASSKLTGDDKARAHYFAGLAQQRLGRWSQARTNFSLARSLTSSAELRQKINEEMVVTGFTLQVGAFSSSPNAQKSAQTTALLSQRAALGVPRIVNATAASGQTLHLVQVGQFSTWANALDGRSRLGLDEAIIVPLK